MVDQRDMGDALDDGRRLAIENEERLLDDATTRGRSKDKPVFKVGASGSSLSFRGSQRLEPDAAATGTSVSE